MMINRKYYNSLFFQRQCNRTEINYLYWLNGRDADFPIFLKPARINRPIIFDAYIFMRQQRLREEDDE